VDYLARVSATWRDEIGVNTAVAFPTGIGAKGNEGVAGFTARTKGAIGYVEHACGGVYGLGSATAGSKSRGAAGPSPLGAHPQMFSTINSTNPTPTNSTASDT
jgi:phosphate transport system substrate-binding protein